MTSLARSACLFVLPLLLLSNTAQGREKIPETILFNRDVRPILSEACFACHGPDEGRRKGDQRFDTEAGLLAARKAGALVPTQPDQSALIERITSSDSDQVMPPPGHGKKLDERKVAILRRWIEQGARWQGHWAYIKPTRPQPPRTVPGVTGPIDRFILARLEQEGVKPAPLADRPTLIRRLSLDLIGLPPSPEEVDAFVNDRAPDAYEKVVDRLLRSPHYGERMALYWLDLARYADSVGYHKDSNQNVWLYRDYVIWAFNENKPFDQFVTEQLAGDLLPGSDLQKAEWKIASGFNRLNQTTSEGGAQAKEYLAKYAADRVRNTAAIFLGVTLGCCECHDHKYDPFTSKDFYSFEAFFADLKEAGVGRPRETPMPRMEQVKRGLQLEKDLQQLRSQLQAAQDQPSGPLMSKIAAIEKERDSILKAKPTSPTIITEAGTPRVMRILPRGNWLDDSGPIVQPAVPAYLGKVNGKGRATRLDLAKWIASRDNPLTGRVLVNRLWKLFLGEGIFRTLDDVGAQGEWPTHPQLLDWLAVELVESGWDVKHLVKQIVMSDTYRRSSIPTDQLREQDPENRLLARQASFRLDAELVRDNALAISGLLSRKMYGRSVRPYQPANYWFRLYNEGKYVQDHGEDLYRRGVYTYWRRSFWHPSLQAFDAPSREECVAKRPRSNTSQQALVLLNDPTYVEAARVLADRMIRDGGDSVESRLTFAYRRALARSPEVWELDALKKLYTRHHERYHADPEAARKLLGVGEYPLAKDLSEVDLAAWTSVARVILNLHETITRS